MAAGLFLLVILAITIHSTAAADQGVQLPENMAIGKQYKLWPSPRYSYCTDPGDATELTDGKTTKGYFWTQKSTVGWVNAPYVTITVDLGKEEPIGGVAFDTAAGVAGVEWPAAIDILVSGDGKVYRHAGELIALDQKLHGPWPKGYAIRRLVTHDLKTHGRFVQFVVIPKIGSPFTFCDEVEIFRGPSLLLAQTAGPQVSDAKGFFQARRLGLAIRRRYESDAVAMETAIRNCHLAAAAQSRLLRQLNDLRDDLRKASSEAPRLPFRATLPFGSEHERLFALQAELWREAGCPLLSASVPSVWDPVPLVGLPQKAGGEIEVHLMRGEYRAAAVNLACSGTRPLQLAVDLDEHSPGSSVLRKAIHVHGVPWTDTSPGDPVAAALPDAPPSKDGCIVTATPGFGQPGVADFSRRWADAGRRVPRQPHCESGGRRRGHDAASSHPAARLPYRLPKGNDALRGRLVLYRRQGARGRDVGQSHGVHPTPARAFRELPLGRLRRDDAMQVPG